MIVKDNVRSGCYGYARNVSRSVQVRVYYILKAHFQEICATYWRRQTLYKFTITGFPRTDPADGRDGSLRFCVYVVYLINNTYCLIGALKADVSTMEKKLDIPFVFANKTFLENVIVYSDVEFCDQCIEEISIYLTTKHDCVKSYSTIGGILYEFSFQSETESDTMKVQIKACP